MADPITFRVCPISLITKPSSFVLEPDGAAPSLGAAAAQIVKCIWLPRRDEAYFVVRKYIDDVIHFYHVIHAPSIPGLVDAIYDGLEQGRRAEVGPLVLLLSIFSSAMFAWMPYDGRCLYANSAEANSQTTAWLKAALDVVDHAHRMAHVSLEFAQAIIVLFFVVASLEGVSSRARCLLAQAIAMGRELVLHTIDGPSNPASSDPAQANGARTEIGRRVWWYLAASDW